jgi:RNA polymerase sigma-70 factor (ECF subfamily)
VSGERAEKIRKAVERLPAPQRELIELYHFQRRSYEEIAGIVALPIGTTKSRLNRARLRLRDLLREEAGSGELQEES